MGRRQGDCDTSIRAQRSHMSCVVHLLCILRACVSRSALIFSTVGGEEVSAARGKNLSPPSRTHNGISHAHQYHHTCMLCTILFPCVPAVPVCVKIETEEEKQKIIQTLVDFFVCSSLPHTAQHTITLNTQQQHLHRENKCR